jgi:hypothetical protein
MPKYLLLIISLMLLQYAHAQQTTLSGKVIDTSENRALGNAVVSLIDPADSILLKFTRTKADGSFSVGPLPAKTFILLITFPDYADYVDMISDSAKAKLELGTIPLTKASELLEAVIVRQQVAAIRVKGDTMEYRADSFAVSQGSTVDELLKKLPGIQVDRNGQITAQGQKVNKVLVDGEEFFSDDPAVVIKNLQAEAVDKVQVFDKKSEQAEFTGIDDGERSKTINLTLKANKKKGYYFKGNLVGGTDERFDDNVMFNSFKGSQKIAAYGIMSNTGRAGLDWQENDRFGGGNDVEYDEENGFFIGRRDDEFDEIIYNNDGLPKAWAAGLHFSNKWNGDNKKFNGNYRFLKKNMEAESSTLSQYILPDTQYFNNQSKQSFSSTRGHQVKGVYEFKFDSSSTVKLRVSGSTVKTDMASRLRSSALNADSMAVNENERVLANSVSKDNFRANVLWRKKFKKTGRTLSLSIDQAAEQGSLDGLLQSNTDYYNGLGSIYKQENVDQQKENTQANSSLQSNITYTEPLSKTIFLSVNYGYNFARSQSERNSFNKGDAGYDELDSLFSNDFRFRYNVHSGGLNFKYNKKKVIVNVGSGVSNAKYRQTDLLKDTAINYSFFNLFPKFSFRFNPSNYRRFHIDYNGRTRAPELDQLQPVRENTDPLNIQLGNPNLRQEFIHAVSLGANDYKVISERYMYLFTDLNFIDNAISTSTVVDEGGKTTYQAINVDGNYNIMMYGGFGWKIKKPGIYVNLSGSGNISHLKNKVNNQDNVNDNLNYNIRLRLGKNKNEKYSFSISGSIGNTVSKSTLRPDVKTKFLSGETGFDAWIKLPYKFEFYTEGRIYVQGKTDVFSGNNNYTKWDANISRKFLKKNNLEIKFSVNDILDQNIGFRRTATSNIITENRYLTLRRYYTLGVHYNISKTP